jgi:hypothetical protein
VATGGSDWIASTLAWLEGARAMLLSLVMDIVCLLMNWIALRLEQARARQLSMAEPREFDAAHAIEDLRDEPSVNAQPMDPPREVVRDGETGEELIKVKPREYWRKRKGQKQRVDIAPETVEDEPPAPNDGGARRPSGVEPIAATAVVAAAAAVAAEAIDDEPSAPPAAAELVEEAAADVLSDDEFALLAEAEDVALPDGEGVRVAQQPDELEDA